MSYCVKTNSHIRFKVKNFEFYQKILKTLLRASSLHSCIRRKLTWQLSRVGFLYSFTFLKNQCILSGRQRSVYKRFNLSRLAIASLFREKSIPYLQKSS